MIRFSLLFLLLASFTYGATVPGDGVIALTQGNFTPTIHSHRHVLVLFYTPEWLTENPLITDYPQFSKEIHEEYPGIPVCQLDVTDNQGPADQYNVTESPTLMLISKMNGASSIYNGDSNSKDIRDWLKNEIGELIIPVTSVDQARKYISQKRYVAFYLGSYSSEDYARFIGWTASDTDMFFMKSNLIAMKKAFGVTENGFLFSRDFAQEESILQGPLSIDNLNQWIKTYKFPTVIKIAEPIAASKVAAEQLDIVFLIKDNSAASAQSEKFFEEIANKFRGKVSFGVVPAEKQHGINLMKSFGLQGEQLPAIALLHSKDNNRKYRLDRELTSQNLTIFLLNFLEGNLVNFCRSAPIPDSPFDGAVKVVVGDTYQKTVLDESSDVLIELYSPQCGHCKKFAPVYSRLGDKLEYVEDLIIAKIDATVNDIDSVKLIGFPMLVFYPRNSKNSPIIYQDSLNVESIIEFLKKHGTVEIDI